MVWYKCPKCGKAYLTEKEMKSCDCEKSVTCDACKGSGEKPVWLSPPIPCPKCNGSGKIFYR